MHRRPLSADCEKTGLGGPAMHCSSGLAGRRAGERARSSRSGRALYNLGRWAQAGSSPLCLSYLFQRKLPDFVVLRLTGFVFLLLLSSLLQKYKTCRPQSNKIKQFVLEKTRTSADRRQGPEPDCSMRLRRNISFLWFESKL